MLRIPLVPSCIKHSVNDYSSAHLMVCYARHAKDTVCVCVCMECEGLSLTVHALCEATDLLVRISPCSVFGSNKFGQSRDGIHPGACLCRGRPSRRLLFVLGIWSGLSGEIFLLFNYAYSERQEQVPWPEQGQANK